jgi:exosortase/archaeosortase family protein
LGSLQAPRSLFLALCLTLIAVAADQLAAPILQSTSPLLATAAFLLLVWRRGKPPFIPDDRPLESALSIGRLAAFIAAHLVLVLLARSLSSAFHPIAGTATIGGTLVAAWKLSVLAPTLLLLSLPHWKELLSAYGPEGKAALVVLFTYLPRHALEALWPWYGQVLGRFVYTLSWFFVPGLGYESDLTPTLTGPHQDITIVFACSGISGFELFGYLFGFVALLDWNRLRKGRALFIYVVGLFTMLLGNAVRIASLVVLGNRGFSDFVSQFHTSAGSVFFSVIFLVYLFLTFNWMLKKKDVPAQ